MHDARPAGPPRGTVLLVPGFTGSKEDFIAVLAPLAGAGYRAVAVDGRGQYESGGPRDEAAYAQRELALDVRAQAAALGDGVHLVGHSLGGLIGRAAVLHDAAPYRSLTLMSSGRGAVAESQRARTALLLHALTELGMSMAEVWTRMQGMEAEAADPAAPPALREFLHHRWLGTVPEQLIGTGRQLMTEPDRVDELARVPLAKHVLCGAVDYAWPVPQIEGMGKELSAVTTVIQGAGHSPAAECPEATAEAMVRFWETVSGSDRW